MKKYQAIMGVPTGLIHPILRVRYSKARGGGNFNRRVTGDGGEPFDV